MGSLKNEEKSEQESKMSSNEAVLYVNGVRRVLPDGLAHLTLLEYLRGIYLSLFDPFPLFYLFIFVTVSEIEV